MSGQGGSALVIENVSKSFGGVKATDGVSLTVDTGSSIVLIGPNGAGKTTLFNLITGEIPPDEGRITLFGQDVSQSPVQVRSELGLARTYQICNLFKELTVEESLYLSLKNSRWGISRGAAELFRSWKTNSVRRERVGEVLEAIKLTDCSRVHVKNLSHGQQRQLEVGMAIAGEPKLILFDEPMAGLSPTERVFIGAKIKELAQKKIIVVIEHDIDFALSITRRVAVLDHGKLLTVGTPDEIRGNAAVQKIYKIS